MVLKQILNLYQNAYRQNIYRCIKPILRYKSTRGSRPRRIHKFDNELVSGDQTIFEKNNIFLERDEEETVEADSIGEAYANHLLERLDEDDKRFSGEIIKARKSKAANGTIILEGYRLIRDALLAGGQMCTLFFTDREILYKIPNLCPDAQLYFTRYRHHKRWSNLVTPPGAMAIFKVPDSNEILTNRQNSFLPVTLILDNIRDPGNMGTLIRTATALNFDRILLSKGCVDVWDSKVLRSAMGSHFYIPLYTDTSIQNLHAELPEQTIVYLADVSTRLRLNVHDDNLDTSEDNKEALDDIISDLPPVPYFNVSFNNSGQSLALIVGGETYGLSSSSYRLCHMRYGSRLFIPLFNSVESLNSSVAASIIASEMQRQFLIQNK